MPGEPESLTLHSEGAVVVVGGVKEKTHSDLVVRVGKASTLPIGWGYPSMAMKDGLPVVAVADRMPQLLALVDKGEGEMAVPKKTA